MQHTREIDPKYQAVFDAEAALLEKSPESFRQLPKPKPSSHLWKAALPSRESAGTTLLRVRATDANGKLYQARRVIRLREVAQPVTAGG